MLPSSVTGPLWKSLLRNLRDRFFPEKLPPLQLTSRPVNTGLLIGDAVSLPWYRDRVYQPGQRDQPRSSAAARTGITADGRRRTYQRPDGTHVVDFPAAQPGRSRRAGTIAAPAAHVRAGGRRFEVRIDAVVALVFTHHSAQGPAGGAEVLYCDAGKTEHTSHRASGAIRGFAGIPAALFEGAPAHANPGKLKTALSRSKLREALLISLAVLEAVYLVGSLLGLV